MAMEFRKITDHVYWMAPAAPDRPSLCAVVGAEGVAMLDAGASCAHARQFLQELESHGVAHPDYLLLTHWHWDHVFGAVAVGGELIAHRGTAEKLATLSLRDWSDAGLERQVASGLETPLGAENIRIEMPEPRTVRVTPPHVVFEDQLELRLGGVTCQIIHVGGDHSADSSVVLVSPDRALFLGDCLSSVFYAEKPYYTLDGLSGVLDKLERIDADLYIEGHEPAALPREAFLQELEKMRAAVRIVDEAGADEARAFDVARRKLNRSPDEDEETYIQGLIVGLREYGGSPPS